jgi:isoquinoline 1-oxidoreductase alpha subunit
VDGVATRSCITPISSIEGQQITTIEGLANGAALHPVQQAWLEEDVVQCGYCQSGQIMSAADLLARNQDPSETEIDQAMSGNICRCGTYSRIKCAIQRAAKMLRGEPTAQAEVGR